MRRRKKVFIGVRFVEIIHFLKTKICKIFPLGIFPSGSFGFYI